MSSSPPIEPSIPAVVVEVKARVEARLPELVHAHATDHAELREAMLYSLLAGGKRLRPALCVAAYRAVGGSDDAVAIDAACAVECLHTYSLVHDDLPAMDNDDLRRGQPTSHRKYGEATAILVGDALCTLPYAILAELSPSYGVKEGSTLAAIDVLSRAAGANSLIAGQMLDLASHTLPKTKESVDRIHRLKTGALLAASLEIGGTLGGATPKQREALREAGILAGSAFQIIDDCLDVEQESAALGKTAGKDAALGRLTYPSVVGFEDARHEARTRAERAKHLLEGVSGDGTLSELVDFLVDRTT